MKHVYTDSPSAVAAANLAQAIDEEEEEKEEAEDAEEEEESVQYDSEEWERWYVDHPEDRPELSDDSCI